MKFDSVLHEIEIGGTAINATVIRIENMDISNQETNFNLKSNKFYALNLRMDPGSLASFRLDKSSKRWYLEKGRT